MWVNKKYEVLLSITTRVGRGRGFLKKPRITEAGKAEIEVEVA